MGYSRWEAGAILGCVLGCVCGCQAATHPLGNDLVEQTAVGKARCDDAAQQQLKPFLVEWDATDLAQFEALAARNLVLVKYEGCDLTVLDGCLDQGIPGRYGTYEPPHFTSGTTESVQIDNEDELYAKLPLGVATFGGQVKMGAKLDLRYHVAGVATATRAAISSQQLAGNPACAEATHFVHQYHLGAFRLGTRESTRAEGGGTVGEFGGGGKTKSQTDRRKEGGDLDDCATHQQLRCRVPIRVVLRPLDSGGQASADFASAPVPASGGNDDPRLQAHQLRNSAREKERNGDGTACLEELDRADALDPQSARNPAWLFTRAQCQMAAGHCEEGKETLRTFLTSTDDARRLDEAAIAKQVETAADAKCPSSTGKTDEQRIVRALRAIVVATERTPPNVPACLAEVEQNRDLIGPREARASGTPGTMLLERATHCLAKAGRCQEAEQMWARYYELNWPELSASERRTASQQTFARLSCPPAK